MSQSRARAANEPQTLVAIAEPQIERRRGNNQVGLGARTVDCASHFKIDERFVDSTASPSWPSEWEGYNEACRIKSYRAGASMSIEDRNLLAGREHWETFHASTATIRNSLPSELPVATSNSLKILKAHSLVNKRVLEIGYAPGKILAWCASRGATVAGIDQDSNGVSTAERLFGALKLQATHIVADVFQFTKMRNEFDLVYSIGVIEHFIDPTEVIRKHIDFCKPGGTIVIMLPNYGGIYGLLQGAIDRENLSLHNTNIMQKAGLDEFIPPSEVRAYSYRRRGRPHLELVSLERLLGRIGRPIRHACNLIGWLFPMRCGPLATMWVLEIEKRTQT